MKKKNLSLFLACYFIIGIANAQQTTSNAHWMSGNWGLGTIIGTGPYNVNYDVDALINQVADIPGAEYILLNLSKNANGDRYTSPHSVLEKMGPYAVPSTQGRDILYEIATKLDSIGLKLMVYVASEGPAKLKGQINRAHDYNAATQTSPFVDNWKSYVLDSLYANEPGTDNDKFKRAFAEVVIDEYAEKFGDLIDSWWFDHAVFGNIPLLDSIIRSHNPNAAIAYNRGQKVPLKNNNPGYEDFSFGHITPVARSLPTNDINLPMITSIENSTNMTGYFGNPPSLGHIAMPAQSRWFIGTDVWDATQAREWMSRTVAANGAWTWTVRGKNGLIDPDLVNFIKEVVSNCSSIPSGQLTSDTISITAESNSLIADSGYSSYQWYADGALLEGETNPVLSDLNPIGNYSVRAIHSNGCLSKSEELLYDNTKTVSFSIQTDDDDVEENEHNGEVYMGSSDIELGFDDYNNQGFQTVGLRYNNLNIPSGATIVDAYLEFTVEGVDSGASNVEISGEKINNSPPFTRTPYNVSNRNQTTATVNWSPDDWTNKGEKKNSPDLTAIVQEIINQSGWQSNNSMSMIIKGTVGTRQAESYDGDDELAPKLIIRYELSPSRSIIASITDGSDDVEENEHTGKVYMNSTDIELGFDDFNNQGFQTVGLRYNNLNIPQGASIVNAYLEFTVDGVDSGASNVEISGEKVNSSPPFTDTPYDVSSRNRTTASVDWSPDDWTNKGEKKNSPDLTAIVQEIVNQSGWQANNSMSMIIKGDVGTRDAESYEGNTQLAPKLIINYEINQLRSIIAPITDGSDDVEENEHNGNVYMTSSDIELGFDSYNAQGYQTVGLRYNHLSIPPGSTIVKAYLEFTVESVDSGASNVEISGEKVNSSPPFTDTLYDVSNRNRTTATVNWSPDDWTSVGAKKYSPDLKEIVQEIINQSGWQSNNSMSMIIKGTVGTREAQSYEGNSKLAPKLIIIYEQAGSIQAMESNSNIGSEAANHVTQEYKEYVSSSNKVQQDIFSATLFPNPADNYVEVALNGTVGQQIQIDLYDLIGRHTGVKKETIINSALQKERLDLNQLFSGVYLLKISTEGKQVTKQLMIK